MSMLPPDNSARKRFVYIKDSPEDIWERHNVGWFINLPRNRDAILADICKNLLGLPYYYPGRSRDKPERWFINTGQADPTAVHPDHLVLYEVLDPVAIEAIRQVLKPKKTRAEREDCEEQYREFKMRHGLEF